LEMIKMEKKKNVGILFLMVGLIILLLSLIADMIGIGNTPGFGYGQLVGVLSGGIIIIIGSVFILKR
jgi:hypothetical protein